MSIVSIPQWQDADDTLHNYSNPEYYEWWYFDARFDNGYSCVATFHWRNPFTFPHIPTVQVFIYTPDGKKHIGMAAIDIKECSSSPHQCDVKMGANFARQEDNTYVISLHARKCGVDLTYHRKIPGWKQNGDGYLYKDGERKQGWVIAAPRSEVKGTIHIDGASIPVSGLGYHDKNWGNANIDDCFRGWYWGRLYDTDFTLIYYWLFPTDTDKTVISRLFIARENQPLLATNEYGFVVEKEQTCELTGQRIPAKIVLQSRGENGLQFRCELLTTNVLERDRLPRLSAWEQYHWRFLGDYSIETNIAGKPNRSSGKAIHEHLVFR
jgi:predicted secreted hydrolase